MTRRRTKQTAPAIAKANRSKDAQVHTLALTGQQLTYLTWLINADIKKGFFAPKFEQEVVRDLFLKVTALRGSKANAD